MDGRGTDTGSVLGILVSRFPVRTETFVIRELAGLVQQGIDVQVLSLHPPEADVSVPELERLAGRVTYATLPDGRDDPNVHWAAQAARHFRALGAVHLHAHFAWGATRVCQRASQLAGLPYSFTAHAGDIFAAGAADALRRYAAGARFVLTCTGYNREAIEDVLQAIESPPPVRCFHHGLPDRWFGRPTGPVASAPSRPGLTADRSAAGPPLVLSVGRLVETKGQHILLRALARLAARRRAFRALIVGEGPQRVALEELARELGLADRVRFAAGFGEAQMMAAFRAASVAVHAGIVGLDGDRDGIPNAVLEAMASLTPVVVTDLPSVREAVAPSCGLVVPPGDASALAAAIDRVLTDDAAAQRLARTAWLRVRQRFGLEASSARLAVFWRRQLQRARRSAGHRPGLRGAA